MRKFLMVLLIFFAGLPAVSSPGTTAAYVIDPVKNAFEHNNMGIIYTEEKNYYAAIQEFKMAISLNPRTQAAAVYFNNLGKVYMAIGYPGLALDCFNNALIQYNLNFEYYQNLVNCYKALNITDSKLVQYKSDISSPLDKIILGLLYDACGNYKKAIITLDEFVMSEPDLIITPAVKLYIQELINKQVSL